MGAMIGLFNPAESYAQCTRTSIPVHPGNPFPSAAQFDCTDDIQGGVNFPSGYTGGGLTPLMPVNALIPDSRLNVFNLTENINPSAGRVGVRAINFTSFRNDTRALDVALTPSLFGAGNTIATHGNGAHGIEVGSWGSYFLNLAYERQSSGGGNASGHVVHTYTNGGRTFDISTSGTGAHGIYSYSGGGHGPGGDDDAFGGGASGSPGGRGGQIWVDSRSNIYTYGAHSHGIYSASRGGDGGNGGNGGLGGSGGAGGQGGAGGYVTISSRGNIITHNIGSHGIIGQSIGGIGGTGGNGLFWNGGGNGGGTSHGGTAYINNYGYIETKANFSSAIVGQSIGGFGGGGGGSFGFIGYGGSGNSAGNGGTVVINNNDGNMVTRGSHSHAILAQSIGGGGGSGGGGFGAVGFGGAGNAGGHGGGVGVYNRNNTALNLYTITYGSRSHGIYAQSIGGGGGDGGDSGGFSAVGGSGAATSNGGTVTVDNDRYIQTSGLLSSAIFAQSIGGGGGNGGSSASAYMGVGGSGGGGGHAGTVTVNNDATLFTAGNLSSAILAQSIGGGGGHGGNAVGANSFTLNVGGSGGGGGHGGHVNLFDGDTFGNNAVTVQTYGDRSHGFHAQSIGGGGGNGGSAASFGAAPVGSFAFAMGGSGGSGGHGGNVNVRSRSTLEIYGTNSSAVLAQSIGGGGGNGGFAGAFSGSSGFSGSVALGGRGGIAGHGGTVSLNSFSHATTRQANSSGVVAQSIGGGGGNGGFSLSGSFSTKASGSFSMGGSAGAGGNANNVTLNNYGNVTTHGDNSHALISQSIGGGGGNGGFALGASFSGGYSFTGAVGGAGGAGGYAGVVTAYNSGGLLTHGTTAHGVLAQSVAGGGGNGGFAIGAAGAGTGAATLSVGGNGGSGNHANQVHATNHGSITTRGNRSNGLVAQSVGGGGGNGGFSVSGAGAGTYSAGMSVGGDGASGGNGALVGVTHTGSIYTHGHDAHGIVAQSIGGGGGNGGFSVNGSASSKFAGNLGLGGSGSSGGNGGQVIVTANSGLVHTQGDRSLGMIAQSVGGGGGNGAFNASAGFSVGNSVNAGIGGSGASGGIGANVTLNALNSDVRTSGKHAHGLLAQSIGGGGGNGGFNLGFSGGKGYTGTLSLGGNGGSGKSSGVVTVNQSGFLRTQGHGAIGLVAQSVGGGGGNGAFSLAGNVAGSSALNASIGGGGGSGGNSNIVNLSAGGTVMTEGHDAYGLLAQSIAGGGGNGGFALSGAAAINGHSVNVALGGGGGTGGHAATTALTFSGSLQTSGTSSHGLLAQSIGGGGGNAGFAGSLGGTLRNGSEFGLTVGGSGGSGGHSGAIQVSSAGTVLTRGWGANAIMAQSIGGGGGNAGFGYSLGLTPGSNGSSARVTLGGAGGSGGYGQDVTINNTANLRTLARYSNGILAQSIGGGGGNGGSVIAGNLAFRSSGKQFNVGLGGNGGTGGIARAVNITNTAQILTEDADAIGILAQSIGGGGGNGGMSLSAGMTGSGSNQFGLTLGGSGGSGGAAGAVSITQTGLVETRGNRSYGILAQSIGGGGGNGGISGAVSLGQGGNNSNYNAVIGGSGGSGNTASNVDLVLSGGLITRGNSAHAVYAQSVGGGGGNGGSSFAATRTSSASEPNRNVAVSVALGGSGGTGNHAGNITVNNTDTIQTFGAGSYGLLLQAIGGGGGSGGNANAFTMVSNSSSSARDGTQSKSRVLSIGGSGGASGDGGIITVDNSGTIETSGADSHAIFAQSIGGGGGNGGDAAHARPTLAAMIDLPDGPSFAGLSGFGFNPTVSTPDQEPQLAIDTKDLSVTVGGSGGASGHGKAVTIRNSGSVVTRGDGAFGLLVQSIGGGGGTGGLSESGETGSVGVGGAGGSSGHGGDISITNNGSIDTFGIAAHGMFVQSIGGGGGLAGNVDRGVTDDGTTGLALGRSGGAGGNGGNITIDSSGRITTRGDSAFGIFAQSVGGGGGVAGSIGNGPGFAGSTGAVGQGGDILITHTGDITTLGDNAHGIYAQSMDGAGAPSGEVTIDYTGTISVLGQGSHAIVANTKDGCSIACDIDISIRGGSIASGNGTDAAVQFTEGRNNNLTNQGVIQNASGLTGLSVAGTGGDDVIENQGTLIGNIDLGTGANRLNNTVGIVFSGTNLNLGGIALSQTFNNAGMLTVGDVGLLQTTVLNGHFSQASAGTMNVDFDSGTLSSDLIQATGSATTDGTLVLNVLNPEQIRSGTHVTSLIEATGGLVDSGITLQAPNTAVVGYNLLANGQDLSLETSVDFTPDAPTATGNQRAIGEYFNTILSNPNPEFQQVVGLIAGMQTGEEVAAFMEQLSPEPQTTAKATNILSSGVFNQRLRSCHQRTGANKFVREGECVWYALGARYTDRNLTASAQGYKSRSHDIAAGAQVEVKPGLHFGAGLSLEKGSSKSVGATASQESTGVQVGGIVKRDIGDTLITGTLAAGYNKHDALRVIDLGGGGTVNAESDFDTHFVSVETDIAHTFDHDSWFIRPTVGTNVTYSHSSSFSENGAGVLGIDADSNSDVSVNVRAGFDVGGEIKTSRYCNDECAVVRPYAKVGYVHYLTDRNTTLNARFQGAPAGTKFTTSTPVYEDYLDINVGAELLNSDDTVVRIDYGAQISDNVTQQSALLKIAIPF
ncbi:MAG: hypothetical protein VX730_00280 [Pseudomonadota bacterium]|nr:hypothetical protein [Pseudomonadota bacterium]